MSHITNQLAEDIQHRILNAKIGIMFDDRPLPLVTPIADLKTNKISVQNIHLAFLWCCCYATVAFNNMVYEKALLYQDIVKLHDMPDFEKVRRTLLWGRSLREGVTTWPEQAGRPDSTDRWTTGATNLYQTCVAYIFFHEIGHLLSHRELTDLMEARRKNPFYETSETDKKRILNAEIEADQFALDSLIANSTIDDVLLIKYIGAMVAQFSNFYLRDTPDTRGSATHPDLDDRLRAVLRQVNLNREADKIQFSAHVMVGLQLFLTLTEKDFIPEDPIKTIFPRFEDLEDYLFGMLENMKNAARNRGH